MSHGELAIQSVLGQRSGVSAVGGAWREAALGLAAQALLAHQPGHALGTHGMGAGAQSPHRARTPVGTATAGVERAQIGSQGRIRVRAALTVHEVVEAGDRHRQHAAQ